MARLTILTSYYRPKPGGFCKRYFRAINALLDQGVDVHYLAVVKFPIDHSHCHFHQFPWPKYYTDNIIFWACYHFVAPFLLVYLGFRYNVTHAFAFGTTYSFILQPLRILKRIPLTLFLRGDAIVIHRLNGRNKWIIYLDQLFEGLAIQGVRVYGVSDTLTKSILTRHKLFKPIKYGTLRNNIDLLDTTVINMNNQIPVLACVGVLEKWKNQRILLQSLSMTPSGSAVLHLYGIGPDKEMLLELARTLRIEDRVEFKGWVDSNMIWPEIDVLAIPSLHEGAPNSVLEALSHQIPVLASEIPEHTEILPAISLVKVDSAEAWAKIIIKLFSDKVLINDIKNQQLQYSNKLHFDWETNISNLILET